MAMITGWSFNWNTRTASITFDQAITAVDLTKISVASDSLGTNAVPLSGVVTGLGTTTVSVTLDQNRVYIINRISGLMTAPSNSILYITDTSATTPALSTSVAQAANPLTPPTQGPGILSFQYQEPNRSSATNPLPWNIAVTFDDIIANTLTGSPVWLLGPSSGNTTIPIQLVGNTTFNTLRNTMYVKIDDSVWDLYRSTGTYSNIASTFLATAPAVLSKFTPLTNRGQVVQATLYSGNAATNPAYVFASNNDIKVRGGANGQVLATDGTGNLSWITPALEGAISNRIENGNSNVYVYPNTNVAVSVAGNSNIVVVTGTGASVTGTANISGNVALAANLSVANNITLANGNLVISNGNAANSNVTVSGSGTITTTGNVSVGRDLAVTGNTNLASNLAVTGNTSLVNLTVNTSANFTQVAGNGNVALGNVANLKILGGSASQVLTTDGTGNLSWSTAGLSNANTSIEILANSINFDIDGTANVLTITNNTISIAAGTNVSAKGANTQIQYNNAGNLAGSANLTFNNTTNNLTVAGNIIGTLANGTSRIQIDQNGNLDFYRANDLLFAIDLDGNSNVQIYANAPVNIANDVVITGNLQVQGNTTEVNVETLSVNDPIISLGYAANGNLPPVISTDNRGLVIAYNITGTAAEGFFGINSISVAPLNIPPGDYVLAATATEVSNNYIPQTLANLRLRNIFGTNANLSGNLIAANIVSNGNLTSNNLSLSGNISVGGAANITGDAVFSSNVNLGAVSSLTISGGNVGWFLRTDGSGSLNWSNVLPAVSLNGLVTLGANIIPSSNATFSIGAIGNSLSEIHANIAVLGSANVDGNISAGNIQISDTASVSNLTISNNFQAANVIAGDPLTPPYSQLSSEGLAIIPAGSGNILGITLSNVFLGDIANIHIDGGSNLQSLITDGNSNLSWGYSNIIAHGNSSVSIPAADGNVVINVDGSNVLNANANTVTISTTLNTTNITAVNGNITNLTGTITAASANQANITNIGTLANLTVTNQISGAANLTISGNIAAKGATTQIQYNNSGNLDGSANLTWNDGTATINTGNIAVTTTVSTQSLSVSQDANITRSLGVGIAPSGTAGEIRASGNVIAFATSDATFKSNIRPIDSALDKVKSIGGKYFDWTDEALAMSGGADDYFLPKNDFGVIAQDVQAVFPLAVRTREDGTLAVDYAKLTALAFAAIAELSEKLDNALANTSLR